MKLTLICGREIVVLCHSRVSPDQRKVPAFVPLAGEVDQETLSFFTVESALPSTVAYSCVVAVRYCTN
jgi:hypothetical protein